MSRTPVKTRSYARGETPGAMPEGFRLDNSKMQAAVGTRMVEGSNFTRNVSTSYRLGQSTRLPAHAQAGYGKASVVPNVQVYMVDSIAPTIDAAITARVTMQRYRALAHQMLKETWKANIAKEFYSGPSRWAALSPRYMMWKTRRGKGGIANLILSGSIKEAVDNAEDAVGGSKSANPTYRIDVLKQFKSAPHVWHHESGRPARVDSKGRKLGALPKRDFIKRALVETNAAFGGVPLIEFIVITETMKGAAVTSPRTLKVDRYSTVDKPGTFSFGWLGRWFSKPIWWLVPPSKALLYFGIASDIRSILTRGVDIERMAVPFLGAWGLGIAGAKVGVPLTKKTARRRTRRGIWRG